ncbi:hypothetical protein ACQ4M4_03420 [Leptolyngbya sp. AN02str]|uniref:hypothetical protein n=1 Tax=Leptolyngbya sp. AN02str TaxID=3423363 RepID=UPI003D315697
MTNFSTDSAEFLSPEECAAIDQSLMTARDRFSTRVAVYALRSLKAVAEATGVAIANLETQQIADWINKDPNLAPEKGFDTNFRGFFLQLVVSSLRPLRQAAAAKGEPIEALTLDDVVAWFEAEAKARIESQT